MTTTMPCQAPFQRQTCFVRSLTKQSSGAGGGHCNFPSPNAFYKKFHKRVFFANDFCSLKTSWSISTHIQSLRPRMPRGFYYWQIQWSLLTWFGFLGLLRVVLPVLLPLLWALKKANVWHVWVCLITMKRKCGKWPSFLGFGDPPQEALSTHHPYGSELRAGLNF